MKKFTTCCAISLAATLALAEPATSVLKGNNVNLRARPSRTAELVTQLKKGDEVKVLETKSVVETGKTQQWSRITLPATSKCYVLAKFVADGKATGDAVNIRCGPGTNFKEVGKLAKGDKVEIVKAAGEWTQIKPTEKCSGWVASEFLEAAPLAAPVIVPALAPAPTVASKPVAIVSAPAQVTITNVVTVTVTPPAEPETLQYYAVHDGIFQTVEPDEKQAEKPLAPCELMTPMFERRQHRIAYLEMNIKDLLKYEGKHVRILGNLRWRRGDRYPVIVVERIEPVW
jgi:uncharacterized protein YraI